LHWNAKALWTLLILLLAPPGAVAADLEGEAAPAPAGVSAEQGGLAQAKTLDRRFDLIVSPCGIYRRLHGAPLDSLRLVRFQGGAWEPVPYQFDERTPEGEKVLPDEGPEANPQDGNRRLDPQDELVFMAHDTGDRAPGGAAPPGAARCVEVTVEDPVTRGVGWCYLASFPGTPPPPSPKSYVDWVWEADGFDGFLMRSDHYWVEGTSVTFGKRTYKQIAHDVMRTRPAAGGTDEDFLDYLKWVVDVRMMFGSIKLHFDFSRITGDLLAMRRGPVRCTCRCWARIRLPMGLKGPKFVSDIHAWEFCSASSVTRLHVPVNPGVFVTNIRTRMGEDFSSGAYGMLWVNSNNRDGFLVDGIMSPMEEKQDSAQDQWRMIVGAQGALLNRAFWSPNFVKQAHYVKAVWVDDASDPDPFELEPGQHAGYSVSEVANIRSGDYDLAIEWYMPPRAYDPETGRVRLEVVDAFLEIMDHPVVVGADGERAENLIRPTAMGKPIDDV